MQTEELLQVMHDFFVKGDTTAQAALGDIMREHGLEEQAAGVTKATHHADARNMKFLRYVRRDIFIVEVTIQLDLPAVLDALAFRAEASSGMSATLLGGLIKAKARLVPPGEITEEKVSSE